jgi:hypothetical protein
MKLGQLFFALVLATFVYSVSQLALILVSNFVK